MSQHLKDGEAYHFDREGNVVKRPGTIAQHGDRFRTSMLMLDHGRAPAAPATPTFDAAQHMPHALPRTNVDDARTLSARQAYINRLNDGWRRGVSQLTPYGANGLEPAFEREQAAYDRYRKRLEGAWKS